jgi:hypothetical protein
MGHLASRAGWIDMMMDGTLRLTTYGVPSGRNMGHDFGNVMEGASRHELRILVISAFLRRDRSGAGKHVTLPCMYHIPIFYHNSWLMPGYIRAFNHHSTSLVNGHTNTSSQQAYIHPINYQTRRETVIRGTRLLTASSSKPMMPFPCQNTQKNHFVPPFSSLPLARVSAATPSGRCTSTTRSYPAPSPPQPLGA